MVSASRPDGLTAPSSTSATAPPAACPVSQHSTIAAAWSAHWVPHGRSVAEHHDDGGRTLRQPAEQRDLLGGQVRCADGRSPRTPRPGAARGRAARRRHPWQRRRPRRPESGRRRPRRVAGRELDRRGRQQAAQLVQRHVDPGRVDLRAAGALVAGCAGELADHRDRSDRPSRSAGSTPSFFSSTIDSPRRPAGEAWWASYVAPRQGSRDRVRSTSCRTRSGGLVENGLVEISSSDRNGQRARRSPRTAAASPGRDRRPALRPGRGRRPSPTSPGRRSPTRRGAPRSAASDAATRSVPLTRL